MSNNKQETWVNIYNTATGFVISKPYPTQVLAITKDVVPEGATYITTVSSSNNGEILTSDEYDNQIPTALEFLHRDESGIFNEVDITQAMIEFAKLHVEAALTAVGNEIIGPVAGSVKDIYPFSNIK
jgi:hypothetical protein